jgi:hypothetical protein
MFTHTGDRLSDLQTAEASPAGTSSRFSTKSVVSFLFLWLLIGFTLGTFVLIAPVRWLIAATDRAGASESIENLSVIVLVIVYVAFSFWLALRLNRYLLRTSSAAVRYGIPLALLVVTVATALEWRNPSSLLSGMAGGGDAGSVQTAAGATFEFGAYPDEARLRELKKQGVTTVVSLQHPSDLVERQGIEVEAAATKNVGIKLINAPMLPWFSDNKEALDTLRKLALHGTGKYYVHCGLGRDRVNIAKKVIEGVGGKTVATKDLQAALGFEERDSAFTHGTLLHLANGVWLVPFPIRAEAMGCLVAGRAGNIAIILDPADPTQKVRRDSVTSLLDRYDIHYSLLPVGVNGGGAAAAADSVHRLGLPATIVASETPWKDGLPRKGAENALAFKSAYEKSVPARALNGSGVGTSYVVPKPPSTSEDKQRGC